MKSSRSVLSSFPLSLSFSIRSTLFSFSAVKRWMVGFTFQGTMETDHAWEDWSFFGKWKEGEREIRQKIRWSNARGSQDGDQGTGKHLLRVPLSWERRLFSCEFEGESSHGKGNLTILMLNRGGNKRRTMNDLGKTNSNCSLCAVPVVFVSPGYFKSFQRFPFLIQHIQHEFHSFPSFLNSSFFLSDLLCKENGEVGRGKKMQQTVSHHLLCESERGKKKKTWNEENDT